MSENSIEKNAKDIASLLGEENLEELEQEEELENEAQEEEKEIKEDVAQNETKEEPEEDEEQKKAKEELEFIRLTSGWTKEEKELVRKIKDPELRQEAIEATRKRRVDFDRRSLELGNTKKELAVLRAQLEELQNNTKPVADEEDDYLTEQELKQKKKLEDVERQLAELTRQQAQVQQQSAQEELEAFMNATNEDGSLKHPHFDRVKQNMFLIFQADPTQTITLEKAYQKAVLLDDELASELQQEMFLKEKLKQKESLEKIKKTKRYSSSSKDGNYKLSPREANEKAIAELLG